MSKVDMNKRRLMVSAASLSLLSMPSWGQFAPQQFLQGQMAGSNPEMQEPFTRVGPNLEDQGTIYAMISFNCPFCRQKYDLLFNWIKSIPEPIKADFMPVIGNSNNSSLLSVMAWEVIKRLPDIESRKALLDEAWATFIDRRADMNDAKVWQGIFSKANVSQGILLDVSRNVGPDKAKEYYDFAIRNKVIATPSVVFSGRILVMPGHASGNDQLFLQLLNGLASAMLEDRLPA